MSESKDSLASSPGSEGSMPRNEHIEPPLPEIVGNASAMQDVYRLVRLAAPRAANVLLVGETGTGKELIARAVHRLSQRVRTARSSASTAGRCTRTCSRANSSAMSKGRSPAPSKTRPAASRRPTAARIFLDEINSTSPKLQVKLLRVLHEREFERVGESRTIRVDVRVIAATNASLEDLVAARRIPRGPLLPAERGADRVAAPARAPRRHPAARALLPPPLRPADTTASSRN